MGGAPRAHGDLLDTYSRPIALALSERLISPSTTVLD
jgi:hypothetical protein